MLAASCGRGVRPPSVGFRWARRASSHVATRDRLVGSPRRPQQLGGGGARLLGVSFDSTCIRMRRCKIRTHPMSLIRRFTYFGAPRCMPLARSCVVSPRRLPSVDRNARRPGVRIACGPCAISHAPLRPIARRRLALGIGGQILVSSRRGACASQALRIASPASLAGVWRCLLGLASSEFVSGHSGGISSHSSAPGSQGCDACCVAHTQGGEGVFSGLYALCKSGGAGAPSGTDVGLVAVWHLAMRTLVLGPTLVGKQGIAMPCDI